MNRGADPVLPLDRKRGIFYEQPAVFPEANNKLNKQNTKEN
jgi:hypothetical protein